MTLRLTRSVVAALGQQIVLAEAARAQRAAGVDAGAGVAARARREVTGRGGRRGRVQRACGARWDDRGQAHALRLDVAVAHAAVRQLQHAPTGFSHRRQMW